MRVTFARLWMVAIALALFGCDNPASSVDPSDLHGAFDGGIGSASASASGSAAPSPKASASASAAPLVVDARGPGDPGCVAPKGERDVDTYRTAGRPACRGAEVREWRDPAGSPRYGCLYGHRLLAERGPLPVVVFLHGTGPGLDDPSSLAKLTNLRSKQSEGLAGQTVDKGFFVFSVQGRALKRTRPSVGFDTDHVGPDNLDKLAIDAFLDQLISDKLVKPSQIYVLGMGQGGTMAATYAMLRADRIAAFAAVAPFPPSAEWICPGPPPPGMVLYRACDALASCDVVEGYLATRDAQKAETSRLRLNEDAREEPSCAVRNKCSRKKGEAAHHRFPKAREKDILAFFARHQLRP